MSYRTFSDKIVDIQPHKFIREKETRVEFAVRTHQQKRTLNLLNLSIPLRIERSFLIEMTSGDPTFPYFPRKHLRLHAQLNSIRYFRVATPSGLFWRTLAAPFPDSIRRSSASGEMFTRRRRDSLSSSSILLEGTRGGNRL